MIGLVLILAVTAFIYFRSLHGEFLTDDFCILDMEEVHSKFSGGRYRLKSWAHLQAPRSLTHWGYHWTWTLTKLQPSGFHLGNLIIHGVNILLVARVGQLLGLPSRQVFLAAAVFAFHPLQVHAVAWISGRAGIQSAMFAYAGWVLLLTGFWPLAVVSQFLAQKSKQDAWVYLTVWPLGLLWV